MRGLIFGRPAALVAAAEAIAAPGIAYAKAERLAVRFDAPPWSVHAAMHLAGPRGRFREPGLAVDVQDGWGSGNTLQPVDAGQAEAGRIQVRRLAQARDHGARLAIVPPEAPHAIAP
ncbi:ABC transporter substrate-binding protein [Roseomonas sp. HF4]|uniref:ABC transporter substrate-binding protein n=1 Tax=Roseomonas sp. HF4 TaxID=2562313 RepID=UPI0010C037A9|nr:ABC transporter substrate-binding protein [Roseomonas sp. HF4]